MGELNERDNVSEGKLNYLFQEILDGIRDDINESQLNVDRVLDVMDKTPTTAIEMYQTFYNDALKVKGQARDRQLKFLALFKERVSTKEKIDLDNKKTKGEFDNVPKPEELNRILKDMIDTRKKDSENMPIIIDSENEDEEIDFDTNDFEDED